MRYYKCIKSLCLEKVDDEGFFTESYTFVTPGSIWEENNDINIIGGEVHLERYNEKALLGWIEISKETLSEAFESIEIVEEDLKGGLVGINSAGYPIYSE